MRSGVVLAHVRATSGTAVQQTNCHPFRHDRWLFMHNGFIARFGELKRDLQLAVDPELFPTIEGTTDSETLFHLALTFGLTDDPPKAVAAAIGLVEDVARRHGVDYPMQGTIATTDGERLWAFRYSSEGRSRSLFHNQDVAVLRHQYPDNPVLHDLSDDTRIVVSEPLGDLRGAWLEVPESTCLSSVAELRRPCVRPDGAVAVSRTGARGPSRARPCAPSLGVLVAGAGGQHDDADERDVVIVPPVSADPQAGR